MPHLTPEGGRGENREEGTLYLSAVRDRDLLAGFLPEHHVFAIQSFSLGSADEERGAIGVGHGQDSRPCVHQDEVLIMELLSIDELAECAVVASEVVACKSWKVRLPDL